MKILTSHEFDIRKHSFLTRHGGDVIVNTSPMEDNGVYYKTYVCSDGSQWFERMSPVFKTADVEVCRTRVKVDVKLFETEAWNTDDSTSVFYYEKF